MRLKLIDDSEGFDLSQRHEIFEIDELVIFLKYFSNRFDVINLVRLLAEFLW